MLALILFISFGVLIVANIITTSDASIFNGLVPNFFIGNFSQMQGIAVALVVSVVAIIGVGIWSM